MTKNSEVLLQTLQDTVSDLLWLSESDSPITVSLWKNAFSSGFSKPEFLELSQQDPEQRYQKTTLEKFLRPAVTAQSWHGEIEKLECQRFQSLQTLLNESLENIRVIKLGEICLDIFILGQHSDGTWVVLHTQSVES